jgi:formylglycine-generating enzyme required for sulfatase activity
MHAMNRKFVVSLAAAVTAAVSAAAPAIDGNLVEVEQLPDRTVRVSYTLENEPAVVIVDLLTNGTDGAWVSVGREGLSVLSGKNNCLVAEPGVQTLEWKVRKLGVDANPLSIKAKVTAYSVDYPPDYMVVDLLPGGDVPRYYATSNDVPGGVLAECYRTDKMLMRRIPAANVEFRMGEYISAIGTGGYGARANPHQVVLSEDYYIGVFELTEGQYQVAKASSSPSKPYAEGWILPHNNSYENIRGRATEQWRGWPSLGHQVKDGSFLNTLRARTGIEFDMPTSAQWEFACRAGSVTALNNHRNLTTSGKSECPYAMEVGWYNYNATSVQPGGLKRPNDWGLYDMHGNRAEMVLDYYTYYHDQSLRIDPVGNDLDPSSDRTMRGGGTGNSVELMMSGMTFNAGENHYHGHRLVCPAKAER